METTPSRYIPKEVLDREVLSAGLGNVSTDLFDVSLNHFLVLQEMGYPLDIREGAVDSKGKPIEGLLAVFTDADSRSKLLSLIGFDRDVALSSYETVEVVKTTHYGGTSALRGLLEGDEDRFYNGLSHLSVRFRMPDGDEKTKLLMRCFMRAHKLALKVISEDPKRKRRQLKYREQAEHTPLFYEFKAQGIKPIDPEGIKEVIREATQDILARKPELAP